MIGALYWQDGLILGKIAARLGCSAGRVGSAMRAAGIGFRSRTAGLRVGDPTACGLVLGVALMSWLMSVVNSQATGGVVGLPWLDGYGLG